MVIYRKIAQGYKFIQKERPPIPGHCSAFRRRFLDLPFCGYLDLWVMPVWRQLFFPLSDNYNSRFPLASKASPYPTRVKRREPVGRPEFHPLAAISPPAFPPVLCV